MKSPFINDDNFFKSHKMDEAGINLIKSKTKMPIGTVSKGFKKIAEGKWVPVSHGKRQKNGLPDEKKKEEKFWAKMSISEKRKAYSVAIQSGEVKDTFKNFSQMMANSTFNVSTGKSVEVGFPRWTKKKKK